jgi:hypothetical protein
MLLAEAKVVLAFGYFMRVVIRISFRIQEQCNPLNRRLSTIDDKKFG